MIQKNANAKIIVSIIGLIFIINFKYQFLFITPILFLLIVALCLLNIYLSKHVITYIMSLITGISMLFPVFQNISNFRDNIVPIISNSMIGLFVIVYFGYKIYQLYFMNNRIE